MAKRAARNIRANVTDTGEALLVTKSSIYPWDDLIPQKDDKAGASARNFFVDAEDAADAKTMKSSIISSGQNYYNKRRMPFTPVVVPTKQKDGTYGCVCYAAAVEEKK